jgi:chromosome partitioning protein
MKIFGIVNQKGGVGKTTTAVNLATALAAVGQRVLLVDLDPQGNASTGLGVAHDRRAVTSYDLLIGKSSVSEAKQSTEIPGLDIIPSTIDLSGAELELATAEKRESRLKEFLLVSEEEYDYVLMDCPPSLGLITINALVAAHAVLIPLQCEFYALEGLSHLLKTIKLIQKNLNPELEVQGVVLTMYDSRNKLTQHIEEDVREFLGESVYRTVIPRNVRMSEAPSHGKPALVYDMQCRGSQAYLRLARELLRRENIAVRSSALTAA